MSVGCVLRNMRSRSQELRINGLFLGNLFFDRLHLLDINGTYDVLLPTI